MAGVKKRRFICLAELELPQTHKKEELFGKAKYMA